MMIFVQITKDLDVILGETFIFNTAAINIILQVIIF